MKRTALAFALVTSLVACGGARSVTPPPGNGGGGGGDAGGGAEAAWAAVMKPGAVFSFNDHMDGGPDDFTTVEATVTAVKDEGGQHVIALTWSIGGEPGVGALPATISVGPAGVVFGDGGGGPSVLTWPAATATTELPRDGFTLYIRAGELPGELCYGEGPPPDAGDCEDVCFAELCVHPTHGLMGGAGTWWPNYGVFKRRDLRK